MNDIFHEGERLAQELAGERQMALRNGAALIDKIIPGAVNFIEKLPFIIVTSADQNGILSTSAIAGTYGFVKVVDERTIVINKEFITSNPFDIFWKNIESASSIGILFIELNTRRRYRLNGSVTSLGKQLQVSVQQAYPNCPKYIQERSIEINGAQVYDMHADQGVSFTHIRENIERADTVFVGSSDADGNLDASHRGGLPGFITVQDDKTLLIPDYSGNSMFNTLGNFMESPNAALLFPDYLNNKHPQMSGTARVYWENPPQALTTGGTQRYWTFTLHQWTMRDNLKGMSSTFISYSRFNPK